MSIVVGFPPSHNDEALDIGHLALPRTVVRAMPLVLLGIGFLATSYFTALIVWGISILLGIL
jgi:hypothetical protein